MEKKFKVWQPEINVMSKAYNISDLTKGRNFLIADTDIFLQYTGLKDKNGREIYDGDIAKYCEFDEPVFVKISENRGEWIINMDKNTTWRHLWASHLNMEIIGNIYENPELIG
jgi:uncharacterized phage protein (TIGR01671 family)